MLTEVSYSSCRSGCASFCWTKNADHIDRACE